MATSACDASHLNNLLAILWQSSCVWRRFVQLPSIAASLIAESSARHWHWPSGQSEAEGPAGGLTCISVRFGAFSAGGRRASRRPKGQPKGQPEANMTVAFRCVLSCRLAPAFRRKLIGTGTGMSCSYKSVTISLYCLRLSLFLSLFCGLREQTVSYSESAL